MKNRLAVAATIAVASGAALAGHEMAEWSEGVRGAEIARGEAEVRDHVDPDKTALGLGIITLVGVGGYASILSTRRRETDI